MSYQNRQVSNFKTVIEGSVEELRQLQYGRFERIVDQWSSKIPEVVPGIKAGLL